MFVERRAIEWEAGYGDERALEWRWPGQLRPRSPEAALRELRIRLIQRRYGIERQLERLAAVGVRPYGTHEVNVSVGEINVIVPEVNALKRLDASGTWTAPPDSAAAGGPDATERSVAG